MTPAELAMILEMLQERGVGGENVRHYLPQATSAPSGPLESGGGAWRYEDLLTPPAPKMPAFDIARHLGRQSTGASPPAPPATPQMPRNSPEALWGPPANPELLNPPRKRLPYSPPPPVVMNGQLNENGIPLPRNSPEALWGPPKPIPGKPTAPPVQGATPAPKVEEKKETSQAPSPKKPTVDQDLDEARRKRALIEGIGRLGSDLTSKEEILLGLQRKPFVAEDARADVQRLEGLKSQQDQLNLARSMDPWQDPSSQESQLAREYLKESGFKVPDQASGASILKLLPVVKQVVDQRLAEGVLQADEQEAALKEEKERKTVLLGQWNKFLASKDSQDLREAVREAEKIEQLIETNPMGQKATMIMMAKAAGDTGRLSDQDIQRWSKRMGIVGEFDAIRSFITSEMTEGHKKQMLELARMLKKKNLEAYRKLGKEWSSSISKVHGEIPEAEIEDVLLGSFGKEGPKKIPVIRISDKKQGRIPEEEFDPSIYRKVID